MEGDVAGRAPNLPASNVTCDKRAAVCLTPNIDRGDIICNPLFWAVPVQQRTQHGHRVYGLNYQAGSGTKSYKVLQSLANSSDPFATDCFLPLVAVDGQISQDIGGQAYRLAISSFNETGERITVSLDANKHSIMSSSDYLLASVQRLVQQIPNHTPTKAAHLLRFIIEYLDRLASETPKQVIAPNRKRLNRQLQLSARKHKQQKTKQKAAGQCTSRNKRVIGEFHSSQAASSIGAQALKQSSAPQLGAASKKKGIQPISLSQYNKQKTLATGPELFSGLVSDRFFQSPVKFISKEELAGWFDHVLAGRIAIPVSSA